MQVFESIVLYLGSQIDFIWKKVTSRKFLLAAAGAAVAYLNGQWELLQGIIIAYLAAEGLDDFVPALKSLDFKSLFSRKNAQTSAGGNNAVESGELSGNIPPAEAENEEQSAPQQVEQPLPFDREAFMREVEASVISIYGVRNACTLFYTAQSVLNRWRFNNARAWEDAKAFMLYLAGEAFKEVWGESYDEALVNIRKPDKDGCTFPSLEYKAMQYGMAHYAILLEYRRVRDM